MAYSFSPFCLVPMTGNTQKPQKYWLSQFSQCGIVFHHIAHKYMLNITSTRGYRYIFALYTSKT